MNALTYIIVGIVIIFISILVIKGIQFGKRVNTSAVLVQKTILFSFTPEHPQQKIVILGDSTAVGVGAENPSLSIAGRIHTVFPEAEIVNKGVSGSKVKDLLAVLQHIPPKSFDIVIIQIGGNDIVRFTKAQLFERNLTEVLTEAQKKGQHVVFFTAGNVGTAPLFPFPLTQIYRKRTLEIRDISLKQAHNHGAHYVDLFESEANDPFVKDPKKYYSSDSFHPSGAGYGVWFEKIQPVLQGLEK